MALRLGQSFHAQPQVAIAASNAITALGHTRIPLVDQDMECISQIPDAVLDGALFAHTNLQGANLNRVSLHEACLRGAQCQQAQAAGLQFGEYPHFEHEIQCHYACAGRMMTVSSLPQVTTIPCAYGRLRQVSRCKLYGTPQCSQ